MGKTVEDNEYEGLLEAYKIVCEDIRQYVGEMTKCLPYCAVLAGLYLGFGIANDSHLSSRVRQYVPYGVALLATYFLVLAYIKTGLAVYRRFLEDRLNKFHRTPVFQLEGFADIVQARGALRWGKKWYQRLPTPPLLLAVSAIVAAIIFFSIEGWREASIINIVMFSILGVICGYVFLIYPIIAKHTTKRL